MIRLTRQSRADLLRSLSGPPGMAEALAAMMGYEPKEAKKRLLRPESPDMPSSEPKEAKAPDNVPEIVFPTERPRLKFWMPVKVEQLQPPQPTLERGDPITDAELAVVWSAKGPPLPPLTRWARLSPFLRNRLGAVVPGIRLDMRKLVREAGKGLPLAVLPRLTGNTWAAQALLLWDDTEEMAPFRRDVQALIQRLHRERGAHGLDVRYLRRLPRHTDAAGLPPGVPVLALSAMGQLAREPGTQAAWSAFGRSMLRRRQPLQALNPCPRDRWQAPVASCWPTAVWDRRPRLRVRQTLLSARGQSCGPTGVSISHPATERLLTLVAPASRIEAPLLRTARLRLGRDANAGTEWDAWHHESCWAGREAFGFHAGTTYEARLDTRKALTGTEASLAREIGGLMAAYHARCSSVIAAEAEFRAGGDITGLLRRVVDRLRQLATDPGSEEGRQSGLPVWFPGMVGRLSESMRADEAVQKLIAEGLAYAHAYLQTECVELPPGVDGEEYRVAVSRIPGIQALGQVHRLLVHSEGIDLVPNASRQRPREWLGIQIRHTKGLFQWSVAGERMRMLRLPDPNATLRLRTQDDALKNAVLATDCERIHFEARVRPWWAKRLFWGPDGALHAEADLDGKVVTLLWSAPEVHWPVLDEDSWDGPEVENWRWECQEPLLWSPKTEVDIWADDYGIAAEFHIRSVPFILRWIPPGSFLMGSPEGEPGRQEDEGPQRRVTISKGYWTGETPVTQAQWRAVVAEFYGARPGGGVFRGHRLKRSPSYFRGSPDLPVESVTWADCALFCLILNSLLPEGPGFHLPSEEQWEHACRAGTTSALYTGDITIRGENDAPELDEIAWYGGNSGLAPDVQNPYSSVVWPEKQYGGDMAGTHAVGQKSPNAWGLFDMLGNVAEWCADESLHVVVNAANKAVSVVSHHFARGGSWDARAGYCRAASRQSRDTDVPWYARGMRLAAGDEKTLSEDYKRKMMREIRRFSGPDQPWPLPLDELS